MRYRVAVMLCQLCVVSLLMVAGVSAQTPSAEATAVESGLCGICDDDLGGLWHKFLTDGLNGTHACNNTGGCHTTRGYMFSCSTEHWACPFWIAAAEAELFGAVASADSDRLMTALRSFSGWDFDAQSNTLTLYGCGQTVASRVAVPPGIRAIEMLAQRPSAFTLAWLAPLGAHNGKM